MSDIAKYDDKVNIWLTTLDLDLICSILQLYHTFKIMMGELCIVKINYYAKKFK